MMFCIPKEFVEKLKTSALKGEVNIAQLYDMSSQERRDFFAKHTDTELGKFINTEFEKAMVSEQQNALANWVQSVFTPVEKSKPIYKTVLDKINSLEKEGVLSPASEKAFLQDLVTDKLGASVSAEEVNNIEERAKKIQETQAKLGNDLGNPNKTEENIAFFKAKKEMDDYLSSLTPASQLKVLTGTIGRGMMLASIKSPILNIGSNTELAITEALSRRLAGGQYRGTDNQLAKDYMKMVNKVYQSSGYDLSRMINIYDTGTSGQRVLGDTVHAEGKGGVRKVGRIVEDIVFKQLMGAPDVAFSSAHFADSVNLGALKMTNGDKVKAKDIMTDAMRIEPQTAEGEILRNQAILDAQTATWTNDTWASKLSEGIRKLVNNLSGDARAGDYLLPFVKTPANVIATGMDYGGMGIPKAMFTFVKALRSGELGSKQVQQKMARDLVKSGVGIVAAMAVAAGLDDDDFVGAWDPGRSQIEALRNSKDNSIRIGGKWISTDWLGPLSVPVTAIMSARKYGKKGVPEKLYQYGKGVLGSAFNIPGVKDIYDEVKTTAYKKGQSLDEMLKGAIDYGTTELSSRLIPSIISDVAKATDTNERQAGKGVQGVMAKFPGLRQMLPAKENVFGEQIKTEPAWSIILFGSRVKTDQENKTIKEVNRITESLDKNINFTDWSKSSSKTLAQFKEKKGEEIYNKAKTRYGQILKTNLEREINKPTYKRATDEEKLKVINSLDTDAMNNVFRYYGFKYKQDKTK